jgi:hypothetical protein
LRFFSLLKSLYFLDYIDFYSLSFLFGVTRVVML